jgi:hypothetical protein
MLILVKILSDVYTEIAGVFQNKPFSVKLEKGFAVIEEDLANYIKTMLKDIEIAAIEEEKKVKEAVQKIEKEVKDEVKKEEVKKAEAEVKDKKVDKKVK